MYYDMFPKYGDPFPLLIGLLFMIAAALVLNRRDKQMKTENRKILERFIVRAEKLEGYRFYKTGVGFVIPAPNTIEFQTPEDEQIEAVLLNVRQFVQDKDVISLRNLEQLMDDPGISNTWKDEFSQRRTILNKWLGFEAASNRDGESITNWDVFRIYSYGKIGHEYNDEYKIRRMHQKWFGKKGIDALGMNSFCDIVMKISVTIFNIARASKEELAR